jgi:hypothetical protein
MVGPRVLYVPNEWGPHSQPGIRRTLANLLDAGLLSDVSVFSLQWRIENGGDAEQHRQDLLARVREFRPNIILMQHLGTSTGLRDEHFRAMRSIGDFDLIYHEGDPYSRYLHPLPAPAKAAGRASTVVFTVGAGVFTENFRRSGSRDVRWAPSVFEADRNRAVPDSPLGARRHDVVIVANRNRPRLRGLPNWRDRIEFVSHLQQRFGERLAIYGHGWEGVGALGPVDFSLQQEAIRSAWVSANWDHFASEPKYFSNRLPISLAAGSIHATTNHRGYESVFGPRTSPFLLLGSTPRSLGDAIEKYLTVTSVSERNAAIAEGESFANRAFRQDEQVVSFLNFREVKVDRAAATASWNIDGYTAHEK